MSDHHLWNDSSDSTTPKEERIIQSLLSGCFMEIAYRSSQNDSYLILTNNSEAAADNNSAIQFKTPPQYVLNGKAWVLFDEYSNTGKNDILRCISYIDPTWFKSIASTYFVKENFYGKAREAIESLQTIIA